MRSETEIRNNIKAGGDDLNDLIIELIDSLVEQRDQLALALICEHRGIAAQLDLIPDLETLGDVISWAQTGAITAALLEFSGKGEE